jgi:hypothetical protein
MNDNKRIKSFNEHQENLNISDVRSSSYIKENPNGYIIKLGGNYYLITNEKIMKGDTYFFPKQNSLRLCESDMESDGINSVRPEWVLKANKFNFFDLD